MRKPKLTNQFKRDYKREKKGRHKPDLDANLTAITTALLADQQLEAKHRDHALTGKWKGFRDCHIKPDLILIYEKPDAETLWLVRLGSHSEIDL